MHECVSFNALFVLYKLCKYNSVKFLKSENRQLFFQVGCERDNLYTVCYVTLIKHVMMVMRLLYLCCLYMYNHVIVEQWFDRTSVAHWSILAMHMCVVVGRCFGLLRWCFDIVFNVACFLARVDNCFWFESCCFACGTVNRAKLIVYMNWSDVHWLCLTDKTAHL